MWKSHFWMIPLHIFAGFNIDKLPTFTVWTCIPLPESRTLLDQLVIAVLVHLQVRTAAHFYQWLLPAFVIANLADDVLAFSKVPLILYSSASCTGVLGHLSLNRRRGECVLVRWEKARLIHFWCCCDVQLLICERRQCRNAFLLVCNQTCLWSRSSHSHL